MASLSATKPQVAHVCLHMAMSRGAIQCSYIQQQAGIIASLGRVHTPTPCEPHP